MPEDDSGTTWVPNLHELNMQHDTQAHAVSMDLGARYGGRTFSNIVKGPLTDKKIDSYAERGWYSQSFQEARRELWQKQATKRAERQARRDGNFLIHKDGRKVYSPL